MSSVLYAAQQQETAKLEADDDDIGILGALGTYLMLGSVKDEKVKEVIRKSLDGHAGLVGMEEVVSEDRGRQHKKVIYSWTILTRTGERLEKVMEVIYSHV